MSSLSTIRLISTLFFASIAFTACGGDSGGDTEGLEDTALADGVDDGDLAVSEDAVHILCQRLDTNFSDFGSVRLALTYDNGRFEICRPEDPDATGSFVFTARGQTTRGTFRIGYTGTVSWTSDQGATGTGWAYWRPRMVLYVAGLVLYPF